MKISIKNICNIKNANLEIKENELTILYGNNGIGKSSIARAIYSSCCADIDYQQMTPFGSNSSPAIKIDTKIGNCLVFNNEYVQTYLFENQDLLNNSYNLIVKTKAFDDQLGLINTLLSRVKTCCSTPKIQKLRTDIYIINSEVQFNNNGTDLKYSSKFGKGFKNGVTINNNIPSNISEYKALLQFNLNYLWFKWISDGEQFCIDDKCPYCRGELSADRKTKIKEVVGFSSSQAMKDNGHSKEIVKSISSYSDSGVDKQIENIISVDRKLNAEEVSLLKSSISFVKTEVSKIESISSLDPISLKKLISSSNLIDMLLSAKINLKVLSNKDKELLDEISNLNKGIDELTEKIDILKKTLIELNKELSKNINATKTYINDFFKIAGIPYEVDVLSDSSVSTRTILKPLDVDAELETPKEYLSYGEQNAISLILFSVEVMSKKPDLVILDDPVSSFDSNKRFALMHYLFESAKSPFYNRTTIFLTHDFNPVIEFIKLNTFSNLKVSARLLLNENGYILSKEILQKNIDSSLNIELSLAKNGNTNTLSRICHLRRYYEMSGDYGDKYEILSSLLHCYKQPRRKINGSFVEINESSYTIANTEISKIIEGFDYSKFVSLFINNSYLMDEYKKAKRFEKLNIVRVYINNNKDNPKNNICWRFICETYHVENLMLFGINDAEFDNIPTYIVSICDNIMGINS